MDDFYPIVLLLEKLRCVRPVPEVGSDGREPAYFSYAVLRLHLYQISAGNSTKFN